MDDLIALTESKIEALDDATLIEVKGFAAEVRPQHAGEQTALWRIKSQIDDEIKKRGL